MQSVDLWKKSENKIYFAFFKNIPLFIDWHSYIYLHMRDVKKIRHRQI